MSNPIDIVPKEKFKSQIEHINEHYDEHMNEILPDHLHRGDIVNTNRLLGYADAMMATCATFLVIPLRNLREMKDDTTLANFIEERKAEFVMFVLGFLIVLTIWESFNVRAIVIKRLDDFLVLFSIFAMLLSTVLPFSLALQGHYPDEQISIITTCCILLLLEIIEIVMLLYAFATPRVLHVAMHQWSKEDLNRFRNTMLIKPVVNSGIVILGGIFSLLHFVAAWLLIGVLVLMPLIRKCILFIRRRKTDPSAVEKCPFFWYFTRGNISKERVECMSDAAVAIIACILILDITVEEFPKEENVEAHGLNAELKHMATEFITFLGSYTTVSMLWYTNHSVLHLFHTVNVVLLYLQKLFLVFACLSPLGNNMLFKFVHANDGDTKLSMRITLAFLVASSMFNFLMLLYGFYTKDKYMYKWAVGRCFRTNLHQHLYIILKMLTIPTWCLIGLLGTLGSASAVKYVASAGFGGVILTFVILKFVFMNHYGKEVGSLKNDAREASCQRASTKDTKIGAQDEFLPVSKKYEEVLKIDVENTTL